MDLPAIEQLNENLLATLNTVNTENGYQYNLAFTRHSKLDKPANQTGILFQAGQRKIEGDDAEYGEYAGTGCDAWWQIYDLVVYYIPAETDTTPIDITNNVMFADIYTALMADYTQGGLAGDTKIIEQLLFPSINGEFGGQTIRFGCLFRHVIDQPYQT